MIEDTTTAEPLGLVELAAESRTLLVHVAEDPEETPERRNHARVGLMRILDDEELDTLQAAMSGNREDVRLYCGVMAYTLLGPEPSPEEFRYYASAVLDSGANG
ncbi:MAG: hypothetical protein ACRBN8_46340 [Nannocystales bacterium]